MKKLSYTPLFLVLLACGDRSGTDEAADSQDNLSDSIRSTPSAIDTVQHPNGVTSGSVISTDTAAMRADTSLRP